MRVPRRDIFHPLPALLRLLFACSHAVYSHKLTISESGCPIKGRVIARGIQQLNSNNLIVAVQGATIYCIGY